MLTQEPNEFPRATAFRQPRHALMADRAAGLKQFGGRFALVQVDRLGLMAARLRFRRPALAGRIGTPLGKRRGHRKGGHQQGRNKYQKASTTPQRIISCPR
jgi:hypothetical protein